MSFQKLQNFAEVIAWFDAGRWSPDNQECVVWQPNMQLSPSQELLTHWLTYITDIQRPWQQVWKEGRHVFREIAKAFEPANLKGANINETKRNVLSFLAQFKEKTPAKGKVQSFSIGQIKYTPRFPNQHEYIERTLTVLAHQYDNNFVKFLGSSINKRKATANALHYVAFDLYQLTYSSLAIENSLIELDSFSSSFNSWDRFGYKRIWAALRDYRKGQNYLELLHQGLTKTFEYGNELYSFWVNDKAFSVTLLELPGDTWNIKFMKNVLQPLAKGVGVLVKDTWSSSYNARQIYNKIQSSFYPEQLDISFDLSAKVCENAECDLCPFSNNDLSSLCLADTTAANRKFCPILLVTCNYRMICNTGNCPIKKGTGKGLCAIST